MARKEGIPTAFEKQGIEVKDFKTWEEATVYLKEIFRDYKDKFPKIFNHNNWHDIGGSLLYKMFSVGGGLLQKEHCTGYQNSNADLQGSGSIFCTWFPLRVGGEFVYLGGDRGSRRARFNYGYETDAKSVASFEG